MAAYQAGHWTAGTRRTLRYVDGMNKHGRNPRIPDLPSGTMRNWAYVLRKANYLSEDSMGVFLSDAGKQLMAELERTPPRGHVQRQAAHSGTMPQKSKNKGVVA